MADEGAGQWAGGQGTRAASEGAASSARGGAFDEAGPGHATAMAAIVSAAESGHALGGLGCDARAEQAATGGTAPARVSVAAHQRSGAAPEQLPALGSADWHAAGRAGLPRPQARPVPAAAQPEGLCSARRVTDLTQLDSLVLLDLASCSLLKHTWCADSSPCLLRPNHHIKMHASNEVQCCKAPKALTNAYA